MENTQTAAAPFCSLESAVNRPVETSAAAGEWTGFSTVSTHGGKRWRHCGALPFSGWPHSRPGFPASSPDALGIGRPSSASEPAAPCRPETVVSLPSSRRPVTRELGFCQPCRSRGRCRAGGCAVARLAVGWRWVQGPVRASWHCGGNPEAATPAVRPGRAVRAIPDLPVVAVPCMCPMARGRRRRPAAARRGRGPRAALPRQRIVRLAKTASCGCVRAWPLGSGRSGVGDRSAVGWPLHLHAGSATRLRLAARQTLPGHAKGISP